MMSKEVDNVFVVSSNNESQIPSKKVAYKISVKKI